jgi:BCCT family betaine/carnitine transporter
MFLGGLSTLQTAAIVGGLPLLVISVMLMISAVRATSLDLRHQEDYVEPTINIEDLPEMDPWSSEGIALARFERSRDAAQEAAELEREAFAQVHKVKKRIRAFALEHDGEEEFGAHQIPQDLQNELQAALDAVAKAQDKKQEASEQAQLARGEFNQAVTAASVS